ncbi:hypothetical protein BH09BAC2_BH09BAC2_23630 [soil metagenome]
MKKFLIPVILTFHCAVSFSQTYFQQKVNYTIDVSLNDAAHSLDGFESMDYTNNSPDTLKFIWIHLWPNAYKNDRTAFSDQLLQNGRTDFYFSNNDKRGYINRLDFKVNGTTAILQDHPKYIDVAQLILPMALAPGKTINITTPFHVQLPFNFSRGGHVGNSYQVTQWFPKPAVYDNKGWHEMPYLDQGEFYSEFGNFDVKITIPENYVVAATGELQTASEKNWLISKANEPFKRKDPVTKIQKISTPVKGKLPAKKNAPLPVVKITAPTVATKTLHYQQNDIHDFAWFADKNYLVRYDTMQSAGRSIDIFSFFTPAGYEVWKNATRFIKESIKSRSTWLGEYPFNVVTALEAPMGFPGGMEYPTITSISPMYSEKSLHLTIQHEAGHNWNYGILATNERQHPWMDEGINTYYENRYELLKYPPVASTRESFFDKRFPDEYDNLIYRTLIEQKKDQGIETPSEKFTELNYSTTAYYKAAVWMRQLQNFLGSEVFDSAMHEYYNRWKFKHPYPEDFKKVIEDVSGRNLDSLFNQLNIRGPIAPETKRTTKVTSFFSFKNTDKYNYFFIAPALGYNMYDNAMIGGLIHNYTFPENKFEFFAAPMYATGSKQLSGLASASYHWNTYGRVRKTEISLAAAKYTVDDFTDSAGNKISLGIKKVVPSLRLIFREKNDRSSVTNWIQWKTFFITEKQISFQRDTVQNIDVISYPEASRYLNQLKIVRENSRVLYPYKYELQAEQNKDFVRLTFEGKYFFNFSKRGGVDVRLFAGKFIYLGDRTIIKQFETDRYHLNMTGANGYEDYTYSNYFIGRNEFEKFPSQQIMIRDGGFKVRSDLLSSKIGKTDDWLAALNLRTDVPKALNPLEILPIKIPLKVFADVGTYAEAWNTNATTGKFLYDAGFQVSLFKDIVNIYIPVLYSKVYTDYFKSTITEKRFFRNISFSIDIQNFKLKKLDRRIPF